MTYKEAYDKIVDAYFMNKIRPMETEFCFCGTLCDGRWGNYDNENYSKLELKEMENALLWPLFGIFTRRAYIVEEKRFEWSWIDIRDRSEPKTKQYEEALFLGVCNALDVLKEIHRKNGENIFGEQRLRKRSLAE